MAGEDYTSPITGLKYTVPKYEEPADAPIAFKDFADSIGPTGIDIDATRDDAVLQVKDADGVKSWAEGMALSVVDAVPADTDGEIGDVVFIPGGPGGAPAVGGGKVLQVVRATDSTNRTTTSTSYVDVTGMTVTITPQKSDSAVLLIANARVQNPQDQTLQLQITDSNNNAISGSSGAGFGRDASFNNTDCTITIIGYATPATTSATTYKLRFKTIGGTGMVRNNVQLGQMFAIEVAA